MTVVAGRKRVTTCSLSAESTTTSPLVSPSLSTRTSQVLAHSTTHEAKNTMSTTDNQAVRDFFGLPSLSINWSDAVFPRPEFDRRQLFSKLVLGSDRMPAATHALLLEAVQTKNVWHFLSQKRKEWLAEPLATSVINFRRHTFAIYRKFVDLERQGTLLTSHDPLAFRGMIGLIEKFVATAKSYGLPEEELEKTEKLMMGTAEATLLLLQRVAADKLAKTDVRAQFLLETGVADTITLIKTQLEADKLNDTVEKFLSLVECYVYFSYTNAMQKKEALKISKKAGAKSSEVAEPEAEKPVKRTTPLDNNRKQGQKRYVLSKSRQAAKKQKTHDQQNANHVPLTKSPAITKKQ